MSLYARAKKVHCDLFIKTTSKLLKGYFVSCVQEGVPFVERRTSIALVLKPFLHFVVISVISVVL